MPARPVTVPADRHHRRRGTAVPRGRAPPRTRRADPGPAPRDRGARRFRPPRDHWARPVRPGAGPLRAARPTRGRHTSGCTGFRAARSPCPLGPPPWHATGITGAMDREHREDGLPHELVTAVRDRARTVPRSLGAGCFRPPHRAAEPLGTARATRRGATPLRRGAGPLRASRLQTHRPSPCRPGVPLYPSACLRTHAARHRTLARLPSRLHGRPPCPRDPPPRPPSRPPHPRSPPSRPRAPARPAVGLGRPSRSVTIAVSVPGPLTTTWCEARLPSNGRHCRTPCGNTR